MKILFAFFIIFSFISLFVEVCHARTGPGEYWERMMGEPMPEQLKQQLNLEGASSIDQDAPQKKTVRFAKEFDVKHTLIIYQSKDKPKEDPKPAVEMKDEEIKPKIKATGQP
ncbi:hypothetical protein SLEP1_g33894 [Rubroshorea leprosula]|uniref:Uncharacterized protein n=1 Tax=Rubroshorea leprosula TaxID=152421 RepID=A0AAV5KI37_9ROSI|nr:hypothetical protein SLEP1_g33894 [Rubroshorea leprosula]